MSTGTNYRHDGLGAPPPASQGVERSDRSLGRGLEDVSHLFLSQRWEALPGHEPAAARATGHPSDQPAVEAAFALLRPVTSFSRELLGRALREFACTLEEGLRPFDANVPCDTDSSIDILAIDRLEQLVVIDYETVPDDLLLLRGISHVDWAMRNIAALRRMYRGTAINFSSPPRLCLVAPGFSSRFMNVARLFVAQPFRAMEFAVFDSPAGRGIAFTHVDVS
jgi:hypothetical protein